MVRGVQHSRTRSDACIASKRSLSIPSVAAFTITYPVSWPFAQRDASMPRLSQEGFTHAPSWQNFPAALANGIAVAARRHAKTARAVHLGTRQCERVPRHGAPTSQRSGVRLAQGRFISSQRSRPRPLRHCHGNDDRIGGVGAHGHLGVHSQRASAGWRPAQRDRAAEAPSHQGTRSAKSRRQSGGRQSTPL